MAQILNVLYVVVVVVFMFGASIFIHEFGHYWMARRRGLKVEAFAIGFGPKIMSWTRDGIEYSWRWLPFGGYVKLPQMVTSEAIEGASTEQKLPPVPPFSKILVAVAGPFMNVVFAFFVATVIYFVGLPVPVNPPIVGAVEPGSPEAKAGILEGDRIISVNDKPVKSWMDVQEYTIFARSNTVAVVASRAGKQSTYYLPTKISEIIGLKVLNLDPVEHPVVNFVDADSPAAKAGLKAGDEFVSFGGVPVLGQEQLVGLISKRPGEATDVVVKRDNAKFNLTVTPRDANGKGRIGVGLSGSATVHYELQHPLPWDQLATVWNRTIDTLGALFHSKQTGVGIKDLSGPPGILAMLAAQVNADFRLALNFLVLLNINLAVLNLLPIPVLDGGHILMSAIERLFRRPLNVKVVEFVTTGFAVLLISFILFVSFNDVTKRWAVFRSMFQHTTRIEDAGANSPSESAPDK